MEAIGSIIDIAFVGMVVYIVWDLEKRVDRLEQGAFKDYDEGRDGL